MNDTDLIKELARLEADHAVGELITALLCAKGYMLNAIIDMQTGTKKSTTEATLNGGVRLIDTAIAKAQRPQS